MKIVFEVLALVLFYLFFIGKLFIFNKKKPRIISYYVALTTFVLVLYCILAFLLMVKCNFINKLFFLFFAISPFIIGRLITFNTLNFYTNLQLILFLLSGFYSMHI